MMAIFWGAVLRMGQAFLQGSPFIVTGLLIAAMLSRLMGPVGTRRLFGSGSFTSLIQSWVIGMLLPGCSLGVIPICRHLRTAGLAVGTIFAFALSSPLFDPLSLLYGLTLSKPFTILAFASCSLVVVTMSGMIFDHWFSAEVPDSPDPAPFPHGVRRIAAVAVAMARETVGRSAGLIGLGILGMGVLSMLLPAGSLQSSMAHDNPWSPMVMTAIAIPAYATPMAAMGTLGSMFQHGNSIGAAFILLVFGAGVNAGLLAWMGLTYGWRKLAVWFGIMLAVVVGLSYGIERPLYPRDVEPAGHTHAFDRYCAPFPIAAAPQGGFPAEITRRIRSETQAHEWFGAAVLGLLAVGGGILRWRDPNGGLEAWLARQPSPAAPDSGKRVGGRFDVELPGPAVALAGLSCIVIVSLAGCYAYYPEPGEALEELSIANTEAVSAALGGRAEHALRWIGVCETWNKRLVVGTYLRRWRVSDYHLAKSRLYERRLEQLEHEAEAADDKEHLKRAGLAASRAFSLLSQAFRDQSLD